MTAVDQMLTTHPKAGSIDAQDVLARCIQACIECEQTCTACADACLSEDLVAELVTCITKKRQLRRRLRRDRRGAFSTDDRGPRGGSSCGGGVPHCMCRVCRGVRAARRYARALPGVRRGMPPLRAGVQRPSRDVMS